MSLAFRLPLTWGNILSTSPLRRSHTLCVWFLTLGILSLFIIPNFALSADINIRDGRSTGPLAQDVESAAMLDAIRVLGETTALSLTLDWVREISENQVQLAWRQEQDGIPVRGAVGRSLLKKTDDGSWFVHYRAYCGTSEELVSEPLLQDSGMKEQADRLFPQRSWSAARLEFVPNEEQSPELAWVFHGSALDESLHSTFQLDFSAVDGRLIQAEEVVCSIDASGTVSAIRTEGLGPQGTSSVGLSALRGSLVSGGGNQTYSQENGDYLLTSASNNFTVLAELQGGWGNVSSLSAANITASEPSGSGNVDLVFDGGGDTHLIAQLNAFHFIEQSYRLFVDSPGGFPAMSTPVNATTGMSGTCNAFYDPSQQLLRFLRAGGGCVDSAYSTVVMHEFGHHVVNSLNLAQGAFGEGYGDSLAIVYLQTGVIGQDFQGPGLHVRSVGASNVTVPCSTGIHFCGQALGKFWFNLGISLRNDLGTVAGQEALETIFVDWSGMTLGGANGYPIRDEIVLEVLVASDDDGDLSNGAPYWNNICSAASAGGLTCPDLATLSLSLIEGLGDLIEPEIPQAVRFSYQTISSTPAAGQCEIRYREAGSTIWQVAALEVISSTLLEGEIPGQACMTSLEWYVRVPDQGGFITQYPAEGPTQPLTSLVATSSVVVFEDPLASNPSWSTSLPSDTALVGRWEWGVPVGSGAQASAGVPSPSGDSSGYFTGLGSAGDTMGAHDVDFGDTTLTSPEFPIDSSVRSEVTFWRWFCNNASVSTPDDFLTISKSLDGGASWIVVEELGPGHPEAGGGWYQSGFAIEAGTSGNGTVRLRFNTGDLAGGSIVEAGVDLIQISAVECEVVNPPPPPPVNNEFIRSDCNGDGNDDLSDAVQILEVLFGNSAGFQCEDACDIDDGGSVDLSDVIQLLQTLFGGTGVPSNGICEADPTTDGLDCVNSGSCP